MTSRVEQRLLRGSLAAGVGTITAVVQGLVQVPLLLAFWSPELLSSWLLVNAAVTLLIAADTGHQAYVGAEFCKRAEAGREAVQPVLGSAILGAALLATSQFSVAALLVGISPSAWFAADPTTQKQAHVAFLVLAGYMCGLSSIGGVVVRLYPAFGLYARAQWFGTLQRSCMFVAVLAAAAAGTGIIGAAVASAVLGSVIAIAVLADVRRAFPQLWPWWRDASVLPAIRQIIASSVLTGISFLDHGVTVGLMAVIAASDDVAGIATFVALRTAANMVQQASMIAVSPLTPELSRYAASGGHQKTAAAVSTAWLTALGPAALMLTVVAPWMPVIFKWWTLDRLPFTAPVFGCLAAAALVRQFSLPLSAMLASANWLRSQSVIAVARGVATVGVALIFAPANPLLAAAGAVLVGEIAGAAIATVILWAACQAELCFPASGTLAAVGQVVVGAAMVTVIPWSLEAWLAAITVHVGLLYVQWRILPQEVHGRLYAVCVAVWNRVSLSSAGSARGMS